MFPLSNKQLGSLFEKVTGYCVDEVFAEECKRWIKRQMMAGAKFGPDSQSFEVWLQERLREYVKLPGVI